METNNKIEIWSRLGHKLINAAEKEMEKNNDDLAGYLLDLAFTLNIKCLTLNAQTKPSCPN